MKNSSKLQKWFVFFLGIAITVLWFLTGESIIGKESSIVAICGFVVLLSTSAAVFYIFFHQKELDEFAHGERAAGYNEGYAKAKSEDYEDRANAVKSISDQYEEKIKRLEEQVQSNNNWFEAGYKCGYRDCQEGINPEYKFDDEE